MSDESSVAVEKVSSPAREIKSENGNSTEHKEETPMDEDSTSNNPKLRSTLSEEQKSKLDSDVLAVWTEQNVYVDNLELQVTNKDNEIRKLQDVLSLVRKQLSDSQHRQRVLAYNLSNKNQELNEVQSQLSTMLQAQVPTIAAVRNAMYDPVVSTVVQKLREELSATKTKLEETQNELSAWKFTPDSNTGKRLMAKCRLLYQENEELGKVISSGRIAKLEGELALQKSFSDEVKKSQSELDEFLQELDEDVEGMQGTIYFLQQQLKTAKEAVANLTQENNSLKKSINQQQDESKNTDSRGVWDSEDGTRDSASQAERESVKENDDTIDEAQKETTEESNDEPAEKKIKTGGCDEDSME
ncbi:pre-mRNA-splicing regulator female-lethal(2)D isoform X2 [Neocloeon triangulifer]|uniref:pre-mRNA-splicing regulator female-lethal(2)D isoform X2 n=1 Tax=Neocloeon triangulifer TaxID=2078957 RepID=UPI00286EFD27|nr:pre-mRNA-splicing regulator female-lethal(2)D isoform X2 [Neocloeon triangulifer]